MAELNFDEDADAELAKLENDPASETILRLLEERVFRLLARDPTDPTLRRRRFSNGLWAVTIWAGNDEISVLWDGEDFRKLWWSATSASFRTGNQQAVLPCRPQPLNPLAITHRSN